MLVREDSTKKQGSPPRDANGAVPHREEAMNFTKEVNKCDVWRNMVRDLDAPFPSPRKRAQRRERERARERERKREREQEREREQDEQVALGIVTEGSERHDTSNMEGQGGNEVDGGVEGVMLLPVPKLYLSTEV